MKRYFRQHRSFPEGVVEVRIADQGVKVRGLQRGGKWDPWSWSGYGTFVREMGLAAPLKLCEVRRRCKALGAPFPED